MAPLDWMMVCLPLAIVIAVGLYARRYVRSVADFVSANRSASRYLLSVAGNELQTGAVVFVASFEIFSHGGFAYTWWGAITVPVGIIVTVTGFVSYRYRETRALTLAQFFEIRYNKSFRVFTGLLGFCAGVLNFGIIPAIGARAMVYFLGLPEKTQVLSTVLPTYVLLMAVFLSVTLTVALSGGVVTVMIINTIEGILSQGFYLIIIFTLLAMFSWSQMHAVLMNHPPGQSMVNPFDTSGVKDFNIWMVLMVLVSNVICPGVAWQNSGAYRTAPLTPHEGRMANVLTGWVGMGKTAVVTLLALAAITYLHHPDFAQGAAHVHQLVARISDAQTREEMEMPIALACLLPIGIKGLFCAVLLMGIFGGDATHMHSWGSVFVQDVLVPLRRKPFGPQAHLFTLRCSIVGVALFAFCFGAFFRLTDYINMWFSVTQALFTGGAGAAIIGGLYWKKGTAAGAWAGFFTGSGLSISGIVAQQVCAEEGTRFFLNGMQIGFFSAISAFAGYIVASLATCRHDFDLDRMLHRGKYAAVTAQVGDTPVKHHRPPPWVRYLGFDDNFTRSDRWITGAIAGWSLFWFGVFVVGSLWNLVAPWSSETWASYYHVVGVGVPVFCAVITGIWFTWGGLRDVRRLFQRLGRERVNALDDGTVVNNRNLDELIVEAKSGRHGDSLKRGGLLKP